MNARVRVVGFAAALILSIGLLGGAAGVAAQATPELVEGEIDAPLMNAAGDVMGTVHVGESDEGLSVTVLLDQGALDPGEHGVHIHETGNCDPAGETTFEQAGAHFNPTNTHHGAPDDEMSHAGDLGNLTVLEDGSAEFTITTDRLTLTEGDPASLIDADGSALIVHANPDDLTTDPSGESGDRLLCAVIAGSSPASPVASPVG